MPVSRIEALWMLRKKKGQSLATWERLIAWSWDLIVIAAIICYTKLLNLHPAWWFWAAHATWVVSLAAHYVFRNRLYSWRWDGVLRTQVYLAYSLAVIAAYAKESHACYFLLVMPLASAAVQQSALLSVAVAFEASIGYAIVMLKTGLVSWPPQTPVHALDPLDAASRFAFILGFAVFTYWASGLAVRETAERMGQSLLADILAKLVRRDSAEAFLPTVLEAVLEHFEVSDGLMALKSDGDLNCTVARGAFENHPNVLPNLQAKLPQGDSHLLEPYVIQHPFRDSFTEKYSIPADVDGNGSSSQNTVRSILVLPLGLPEESIGVVILGSALPGAFTTEKKSMAGSVAAEVSLAVQKALLVDELRRRHAELTETYNALLHSTRVGDAPTLAAAVAHEARNPLNNIMTRLDVIESRPGPSERGRQDVAMLRTNCERIQTTLDKLLSYWVDKPPSLESVRVIDAVESAVGFLEGRVKALGLKVALQFDEESKAVEVMADPQRLQSAFEHILANAIDAECTDIEVNGCCVGSDVRIVISDDGCGMTQEEAAQLFNAFKTFKTRGSGLGGFSMKRVINELKGDIRVLETTPRKWYQTRGIPAR